MNNREDCEHFICGSCCRIRLDRVQCSLCKRSKGEKSTSAASTQSSDRDQRRRSRSKKLTPDIKPLYGHYNYRIRSSGAYATANHREGHVVANTSLLLATPPSSPDVDPAEEVEKKQGPYNKGFVQPSLHRKFYAIIS